MQRLLTFTLLMGLRAEPDLQKHLAQGSVHGHFFCSVGMQGWRRNMEDNGVIMDLPNGDPASTSPGAAGYSKD